MPRATTPITERVVEEIRRDAVGELDDLQLAIIADASDQFRRPEPLRSAPVDQWLGAA